MNDHVTKPIAPERLMASLAKWVRLPADRAGNRTAAMPTVLPAGSAAVELPADLLALSSIDARAGIRRIGGKAEAYRKQLRRFREHYPDAAAELRRLMADAGAKRAEEYCHALKGVSGNIGAKALYEKVAEIDTLLKQEQVPAPALLDDLEALLRRAMQDIDSVAVVTPPVPSAEGAPLGPGELLELLKRLVHALDYDLGAAEPVLLALRAGTTASPVEPEIVAIAAQVDVFDIDSALAQVHALMARLESSSLSSGS